MTELGKYGIIEEIGRGGFGIVYKARDTTLDRIVALKVLHPQLTLDPKFIQRFYHEARTAAGLRHPHIVTIHEVGEEAGQHYLAMEFLPGQPLSQLIESEPLPMERAVSILEQIAGALDAVHQEGLIHRDVKPINIRVDDTGQATLLDFGIVRAAEGTRLTTTMAVLGTPEYMAPEQAEIEGGTGIDWRVDVYALGVVAYEILVGRPPFTGRSPTGILYQHIHEPPPRPTALNPDLPQMLEPVLLKALAKKQDERYQSAGEMVRALKEAAEAESRTRQQEERLAELYKQVQEAVEGEDWATAEGRCREILALEPEYQDVPGIWGQVRDAQARQQELEELYVEAQAKAKRGAWAEVKDLCQRVETLERGYRDVDELLRQAEAELRHQQAEEEQRVHLSQLYKQLQAAAAREGDWAEVLALGGQIAALDADYRDVPQLVAQARERFHLSQLYKQLQAAAAREDWAEVLALGGQIAALDADYRDVLQLVAQARERFHLSQLYKQLQAAAAREDWAGVLNLGGQIRALDVGYRDVAQWVAQARERLQRPKRRPEPAWASEAMEAAEPASREKRPRRPARQIQDTMLWKRDGKLMVRIPAGTFLYGKEKKEVELPEFWIDKTPVTNAEYARFVAATGHRPPKHWGGLIQRRTTPPVEIANHPVVEVSWYDAVAYAEWAGKRLPTEQEWEKAARGTDGRKYPWGDWEKGRCNCSFGKTTPVGQYSPAGDSPYGCVDMAGNVSEWTSTPTLKILRVVRGGSWRSLRGGARCAYRYYDGPGASGDNFGFRCVSPVS